MNLDDLQHEVAAWQEKELRPLAPRDALADALILAEEVGEVCRCVLKRHSQIRGTSDHWGNELKKEAADVQIGLLSLAANEGFSLSDAVGARWAEVGQRKWATAQLGESRDNHDG